MKDKYIDEKFEWQEEDEEQPVFVTVVDSETGAEAEYFQEFVLPVNGKNFALLLPPEALEHECCEDEECSCHENNYDEDEFPPVVARVEFDENGEMKYFEPTDEEYEEFMEAYNALEQVEDEV